MPVTVLEEHSEELRFLYGLLKKRGKQNFGKIILV